MNTNENGPSMPGPESNQHPDPVLDRSTPPGDAEMRAAASHPAGVQGDLDSHVLPQRESRVPNNAREKANETYEVGYRRPPKHTRFKPGVSGNPKGRRRRTWSMKGDLRWQFLQKVPVQVGSKRRHVTKLTLLMNSLINKGIKGDTRAAQLAYKFALELGLLDAKLDFKLDLSALTPEDRKAHDDAHKITSDIYYKYRLWNDVIRIARDGC